MKLLTKLPPIGDRKITRVAIPSFPSRVIAAWKSYIVEECADRGICYEDLADDFPIVTTIGLADGQILQWVINNDNESTAVALFIAGWTTKSRRTVMKIINERLSRQHN